MEKPITHFSLALACVSWLGVFGAGGARAANGAACETSAQYGSLLNADEFSAGVQALPPAALLDPPLAPVLPQQAFLQYLPAVAQQGTAASPGSPGSCEAQSFGYGLGSYTAARHADGSVKWNPGFPQNSVSSAFLYALAHKQEGKTCPQGSLALGYLRQLVAHGSPTRQLTPYYPYCSYLDTIAQQPDFPNSYPDMQRFRIGSYAALTISDNPDAILRIKQYIANKQAVAFSGKVLCGYEKRPTFTNGVIYETGVVPDSGHGQLVVGYSDKVGAAGRTGALLIQNSFGVNWPPAGAGSIAPRGMAYWSYNTFARTQQLAAVAYPRAELTPGEPLLSANDSRAPLATIRRAYQWAPGGGPNAYLILTHVFGNPVLLTSVELTEPGAGRLTVTANYGQYISSGYSYLKRADGSAFLSGVYRVTLKGLNLAGEKVSWTGAVDIGASRPVTLAGKSMGGVVVTGSTGAPVIVSVSR